MFSVVFFCEIVLESKNGMTLCEAVKASKKRPVPKKGEGEDPADENDDPENEPPKEKKPRAAKSRAKAKVKKADVTDEKPVEKCEKEGKKPTTSAAAPESKPPGEASTNDLMWKEKERSGLKHEIDVLDSSKSLICIHIYIYIYM